MCMGHFSLFVETSMSICLALNTRLGLSGPYTQFYWGNVIDINSLIKDFCINTAHTRSITLHNVENLTIKLIVYGGLLWSAGLIECLLFLFDWSLVVMRQSLQMYIVLPGKVRIDLFSPSLVLHTAHSPYSSVAEKLPGYRIIHK